MPVSDGDRALGGEFRRFWLASASSNLGDGIRLAALPLLALSITDDARLIALVSAATTVPWLIFGLLGGAIVDRGDRRRLMIWGQLGRAVLVSALAATISTGHVTIWWIVVVALGLGFGEVIVDSASQAAVPLLVDADQLDRANGQLIAAITVLDQVAGVALGAVLFAAATGLPFVVDAATFFVGAVLLTSIRKPLQGTRSGDTTMRSDIGEGARFLFRHRFLRGIMFAVAMSNLAGNVAFGVFVLLVVDELGASETTFGLVLSVGALGGVRGIATHEATWSSAGLDGAADRDALVVSGERCRCGAVDGGGVVLRHQLRNRVLQRSGGSRSGRRSHPSRCSAASSPRFGWSALAPPPSERSSAA